MWAVFKPPSFFEEKKMKFKNLLKTSILVALSFVLFSCKYSSDEYNSAVDQAYDQAQSEGYADGYTDGEASGYDTGYSFGEVQGYQAGYQQALVDHANPEYWQGYDDGYVAGDNQEAYDRGYGNGVQDGYNTGYNTGYNNGYDEAFNEGHADGFDDTYNTGYIDGLVDGELAGYDIGYDDGLQDGYDTGFYDGDAVGFSDGYDFGIDDGYDIGFDDGYGYGYDDGYNVGFDDGWFAAGGSSSGKKAQAQKLVGSFLNDLIDFDKMKTPKQVLTDPTNKKLLLSSTAGMTVDTKKKKAILNKYIVGAMKNQLITKFALSEKRSHQIAKLANHMIKSSNAGEMNMGSVNTFSKRILGANFKEMQDAYKASLTGNSAQLNKIVKKASELNEITPDHTQKIMSQLFL